MPSRNNLTFDREQFLTYLRHHQIDCELNFYPQIDSTNIEMGRLIDRGLSLPRVAIAATQSSGRGQWGRQWCSEPGGLYLTLGLEVNVPIAQAFHLTLMAVTPIAHSFHGYDVPVGIKWPNDLILNKCKLGGIKTDIRQRGQTITHACIGVGINWQNSTPDRAIAVQNYHGHTINSWEQLAAIVTESIIAGYQRYQNGDITAIVTQYNQLLVNRGKTLNFAGNRGTIEGITPQGELLLKIRTTHSSSLIKIPIGEISLGYDNL